MSGVEHEPTGRELGIPANSGAGPGGPAFGAESGD
jgi:hypothetical protein